MANDKSATWELISEDNLSFSASESDLAFSTIAPASCRACSIISSLTFSAAALPSSIIFWTSEFASETSFAYSALVDSASAFVASAASICPSIDFALSSRVVFKAGSAHFHTKKKTIAKAAIPATNSDVAGSSKSTPEPASSASA